MKEILNEIKYPVGIQTFRRIREDGYLYVDKTGYIPSLLRGQFYFLSRPRRFGKSLFLSTLESFFNGEKHLFKGLAIEKMDVEWICRPVLHIDLSSRLYEKTESLVEALNAQLEFWEEEYGNERQDRAVEERFGYIIRRAYEKTGKEVVILVDEYDKPMLAAIDKPEILENYRKILKAFYSNLKSMDRYIKFAMLTGVARFSKVSIFSDLNNLNDISFVEHYAAICGITAEELESYFNESILQFAEENDSTPEKVKSQLKQRYDGYHFTKKSPDIYNPYSLMKVFENKSMESYWFESGTPTHLVSLIKSGNWRLAEVAPITYDAEELKAAGILSRDPVPVLYQAGYLTIKWYDSEYQEYLLDYPNEEVKTGFLKFILKAYIPETSSSRGLGIRDFIKEIRRGEPEAFMKRFNSLLAGMAYNEKGNKEARFQDAIYLIFTLLGESAQMEQRTSDGRIDLKVETSEYIYIFEFKIDSDALSAIDQIKQKQYWMPFQYTGKTIYLIGANFDTKTGRLSDYIVKQQP